MTPTTDPFEWLRWAVFLGLDGLVLIGMLVVAAILLRKNAVAAGLVAVAATLRFGEIGLSVMANWAMRRVIDELSANGSYELVPWIVGGEQAVFTLMTMAQWLLVVVAVYVGRQAPS
ncbi:MAG: hypothetical protein R3F61_07190 [Myxococcota bacterium]